MGNKFKFIIIAILCSAFLWACGAEEGGSPIEAIEPIEKTILQSIAAEEATTETEVIETESVETESTETELVQMSESEEAQQTIEFSEEPTVSEEESVPEIMETIETVAESSNGFLVVIDPGHQQTGNNEKEPIGPGAEEMKAKVASGTRGCVSGLAEYELTLQVGLKLQEELENRGYEVIMVRTTHDVNISNAERAQIANDAGADAFIRIHADGLDNPDVHGATTLCQTPQNPYNGSFYEASRKLSEAVLDGIVEQTGCKKRSIQETDTMSGINWCQVPVTIVEMGFMTNPEEDALMATEDYQYQLARGMADGIDEFLGK